MESSYLNGGYSTGREQACARSERAGELRERLEARSSAERFQLLEEALLSRLCQGVEHHYAVSTALEMFWKNQAGPTVREAAKYLGLSQRRFIQCFKAEVGMTRRVMSILIIMLIL